MQLFGIYIINNQLIKESNRVFRQIDGLQLQEVGDFEALNCLTALHLIRSTKLDLTTEPPLLGRCCYSSFFYSSVFLNNAK